jgi:hypothetical protein
MNMEQFIEQHKNDKTDYTQYFRISPAYLSVLIHCHGLCSPIKESMVNSEAVEVFLRDGIIEIDTDRQGCGYRTTEKGETWLEMILTTPYPEFRWIDPRIK